MRFGFFSMTLLVVAACAVLAGCAPMLMPLSSVPGSYFEVQKGETPVRLAVRDKGRGRTILLLHGLGASSYTWNAIIPELAKTNRVIALDLKGFGDSDKPLDNAYSIADQAKLVKEFMARNDLRGVTLVGHSFGGAVAISVALDDVEAPRKRVERLVLVDSLAYKQPVPFFFRLLRTPVLGELGLSLIPPDVQISRAMAVAYYHDWKVKPETIATYASPLQSEGGKHALLSTIDSLMTEDADAFVSRYNTLRMPTLLIWCEHDKIVPLAFGKRLMKDLPNAKIDLIEECGHIPQEEQPLETLAALQAFAPR